MSDKFNQLNAEQKKKLTQFLDVREESGRTALFLAAEANRVKCMDVLLRYKASTETENHSGVTPLGVAIDQGHTSAALLLIQHGARVDVKVNSKNLAEAAAASIKQPKEKIEVIKALLSNGCVVEQSVLDTIKKSLPAELASEWDEALTAAAAVRAKNFSNTIGSGVLPNDTTQNAPMDQISAFLGFNQPLLQENKE